MSKTSRHAFAALVLFPFCLVPAFAGWDIVTNPATGTPEAVWCAASEQGDSPVKYSYLDGSEWIPSIVLGPLGKAGSGPMLGFNSSGGRNVVWGTSESPARILLRTQQSSGSDWSEAVVVSDPSLPSEHPWILVDRDRTFVSYESTDSTGARSVTASKIFDGGSVERTEIRSTLSTAPLQPQLHAAEGHLWIDWVDSTSDLGFSVWDEMAGWGSVRLEPYAGAGDLKAGRERIRALVIEGR